ncbi:MAG: DUF1127 domain-containing protein [Alphaproteobacteria bacterium]|nr:DUF1127 domain-containing protein [Alphaproteobacteria bacterium]MCW5741451.1 DUF1127 domain-containing protein [Alphaproteobacteria bacterium]
MTIFTIADLRDHPTESILSRVPGTLALWRKRARERAEIAQLSARDARDLGIDPGLLAYEASKPFWRA